MTGRRNILIQIFCRTGLVTAALLVLACGPSAYALTSSQETCVNTMNKSGSKVAATQGKESASCVKDAGKGKLTGTAEACLTADRKNKVSKATGKTSLLEGKKCTGTPPNIAYTGSATTNQSAIDAEVALAADVFGTPLDNAIIDGSVDKVGAACQATIVKAYEKFGKAYFKDFLLCTKDLFKSGGPDTIENVNNCIGTDVKGKLSKSRGKILSTVQKKCAGVDLATAYPGACTGRVGTPQDFADCLAERAICQTCEAISGMDAIPGSVKSCDTLDDGALNGSCSECGNSITEAPEECDDGGESATCDADCTLVVCGDGTLNTSAGEECDDGNTVPDDGCTAACTTCGDGIVTAPEECDDGNLTSGDGCSASCTCGPGSGEVGCQDSSCPNRGELTIFAGTGKTCATNTDCEIGDGRLAAAEGVATCDPVLGRCTTVSELDTGWTGIAHDSDTDDRVVAMGKLLCPGPGPTCGPCEVLGVDPSPGNCRCETDQACNTNADCPLGTCVNFGTPSNPNRRCVGGNQVVCDEPFQADVNDCNGEICNCYFGPPLPLSSGNTPACALNKFAQDVTGTANVDTGDGEITAKLAAVVALGINIFTPCPYCTGDTTIGDGVRDGTCVGGENDGDACDADASNTTFPAPGGDGTSLDCFPSAGLNVSGAGLKITLRQTTGTASLPAASVPCGFVGFPASCSDNGSVLCSSNGDCGACLTNTDCGTGGLCDGSGQCSCDPAERLCPCGLCTDDQSVACSSNGDCGSCLTNADCPGAGTISGVCDGSGRCSCERRGLNDPNDNTCNGGHCAAAGGGEGVCVRGPSSGQCDGIVRANGEGFIECNSNADCGPGAIGTDAGNCTLSKTRECFLDPIAATGVANANRPVAAAAFCIPPTGNSGINGVAGLPGPARVFNQASSRIFCASNPSVLYEPGVGGCP